MSLFGILKAFSVEDGLHLLKICAADIAEAGGI